jgi:hypothetical protein
MNMPPGSIAANQTLFPTAALRHMRQRRLLDRVLECIGPDLSPNDLVRLARSAQGLAINAINPAVVDQLEHLRLAQRAALHPNEAKLPFLFVTGINLELTYGCNLACSHCLQQHQRPLGAMHWLNKEAALQVISQAHWLGLLGRGVNITGGEVFQPGSPLLELLDQTKRLGIPTRLNTNAWWSQQRSITIGHEVFDDDRAVLTALRRRGLARLVFSLDDRYRQYPQLLPRVIHLAALCETRGQTYEVVATDPDPDLAHQARQALVNALDGQQPRLLIETPMEMVDVGHSTASGSTAMPTAAELARMAGGSPCRGGGFHRPFYLHINPDGGLRSCLYAPGGGWLGSIQESSLVELLNRAARNPVVRLFQGGRLEAFLERAFTPWRQLYRPIEHPCSASALTARLVEHVEDLQRQGAAEPSDQQMHALHQQLATELGLAAKDAAC